MYKATGNSSIVVTSALENQEVERVLNARFEMKKVKKKYLKAELSTLVFVLAQKFQHILNQHRRKPQYQ